MQVYKFLWAVLFRYENWPGKKQGRFSESVTWRWCYELNIETCLPLGCELSVSMDKGLKDKQNNKERIVTGVAISVI